MFSASDGHQGLHHSFSCGVFCLFTFLSSSNLDFKYFLCYRFQIDPWLGLLLMGRVLSGSHNVSESHMSACFDPVRELWRAPQSVLEQEQYSACQWMAALPHFILMRSLYWSALNSFSKRKWRNPYMISFPAAKHASIRWLSYCLLIVVSPSSLTSSATDVDTASDKSTTSTIVHIKRTVWPLLPAL